MKRISMIFLILIAIISTALLSLSHKKNSEPNVVYKVYLDGQLMGNIYSKTELEEYINNEQREIKEKYLVEEVYTPNGLEIKKEVSYNAKVEDIKTIYDRIKQNSVFTVKGYQITITKDNVSNKIYVIDKDIFKQAVETVIKAYVGTEKYEAYINDAQDEITETGTYITDIYVDNDITIKEINIPSNEKIYIDAIELSNYLLFGENKVQEKYTVEVGDTIEQVAYKYEISVEEFLMSNTKYKKETTILAVGDEVVIGVTDPKINVTISQENTKDIEQMYKTVEKYDSTMLAGYETVTQQGVNGVVRTKQNEKIVNGTIVYVQQISNEIIKPATDKIVVKGAKQVPSVGGFNNWVWPTDSYYITSYFAYRISPITGLRELHGAIDIANSYGSKIYAANNGTIVTMSRDSVNGIYIVINHNNGYYSQYNHMSAYSLNLKVGQTVQRGDVIGYVGMTGAATGPHLHFAVWYGGRPFSAGASRVNPLTLYK